MSDLDRVRVWAEALIAQHLDSTWRFAFDHAKVRAGLCDFTRKRITVSRYLAARFDDEDNYQTLLHEVAHALAGPREGHNRRWLSIARELGYVGGGWAEVLDGLKVANSDEGNAAVEAAVREKVVKLTDRFPMYSYM